MNRKIVSFMRINDNFSNDRPTFLENFLKIRNEFLHLYDIYP